MTYRENPIRCIEYESPSIIVEIDLTWSLGLVSVELDKLPNLLSCSTLLICPIWISKVLIDAPWFLMAAFVEAWISLIRLEYSAFGRHLEEIHVTWAHLEKNRQDYEPTPTSLKNFYSEAGDGVTDYT
ncbi:hypothetical protein Tco_1579597 [Tanacetum coccineum]